MNNQKIMFTGMQPSGTITLGNYLGVIKPLLKDHREYQNYFCIVDLHAYTSIPSKKELSDNIKQLAAFYASIEFDFANTHLFIQSSVKEHLELAWILQCLTNMGELNRMTQYKEKSDKGNQGVGLFTYPTLMAADILLYNASYVYVGQDQKQHLELTRDLAIRFNNYYSPTFNLPEVLIPKNGAKIMSLQNPVKKMSKSDSSLKASILITDSPKQIEQKINSAVTDLVGTINYDLQNQPGISNLLVILASLHNQTIEQTLNQVKNLTYGEFKKVVSSAIINELTPIQEKMNYFMSKEGTIKLKELLDSGAHNARNLAMKTINKVYRKTGIKGINYDL